MGFGAMDKNRELLLSILILLPDSLVFEEIKFFSVITPVSFNAISIK